uniref:Putative secreted protein n=1 Tax=Ixodes ricinus TaxID=34613 RepID=V5GHD4_IXORI
MDAHRLMLCIWLWLVCASVQCLPRVRLSSRQQIEGETRITIDFYIDDSVDATEQQVKDYLRTVIFTTTADLQSYFVVDDIQIYYWISYLKEEPALESELKLQKNTNYIYLDGAIDTLTAYFERRNPPDIICLVTKYGIYNGDDVRNAYVYYKRSDSVPDCRTYVASIRYRTNRTETTGRSRSYHHDRETRRKPERRTKCASPKTTARQFQRPHEEILKYMQQRVKASRPSRR